MVKDADSIGEASVCNFFKDCLVLALADELLDEVTVDYLSSDADLDFAVDMPHQVLKLPKILLFKTASEIIDVFFLLY